MGVKVVKEITSGSSSSLALDAAQGGGSAGLKIQRAWRLVYDNPSDHATTDVRKEIGVTIGAAHPTLPICACDGIDIKPDGDSRHVYIITANYSSQALSLQQGGFEPATGGNQDPRTQPPQARKANWSTDASTIEAPSWVWKTTFRQGVGEVQGAWDLAVNPVGDMYDGVVTMQPIVTIRIEQLQQRDPNNFALYVGYVNTNQITLGSLNCPPRSVMLRGIAATPHIEIVGSQAWRGWKANYEFVYKPGYNSYLQRFLGWDVAIPVSGWNVLNVAGALADNTVDKGALALKLANDMSVDGWEGNAAIEPKLLGKKSRANVLISAPDAKATQRPSAQPVALNWNGTPRNLDPNRAGGRLTPLIEVNQVYADFDFSTLNLKLD